MDIYLVITKKKGQRNAIRFFNTFIHKSNKDRWAYKFNIHFIIVNILDCVCVDAVRVSLCGVDLLVILPMRGDGQIAGNDEL